MIEFEQRVPSAGRARQVVADCLVACEAHLEEAVEALCRRHAEQAAAIRDRVEAARAAGLNRTPIGTARPDDETYEPIGPYRPLSELGRGGQGIVYLAEDTRLKRRVALKILRGFGPLSESVMERFRREAEVASRLDDPGICPVYDAGVREGIPYIAMRFIEGGSLADWLKTARARGAAADTETVFVDLEESNDEAQATDVTGSAAVTASATRAEVLRMVRIGERAALALHAAHDVGVIHRDVKPGNIMVTPADDPVLLDFGLASEEANELSLTRTGDLFGTPAYMSPEQLAGKRLRIDCRSDVYSLAVTLYECVTLRRPFEAPTREALYHAIQFKPPPGARRFNRDIPVDLAVVLEKALEKDPDARYPTALALAEDLKRVREQRPIQAKPVSPIGRLARWARRRPFRAALLVTLVAGTSLLASLSAYALARQPEIRRAREQAVAAAVEARLEEGFAALCLDRRGAVRAIAAFGAALDLDPGHTEAIAGKALALQQTDGNDACLRFLDAHREAGDAGPALARLRVRALRRLGRDREADRLARREAEGRPTAFGFFLAGCVSLPDPDEKDGDAFRAAHDAFARAVFAAPDARPLYHNNLSYTLRRMGRPAEAIIAARAALAIDPENVTAHRHLGGAFASLGRYDEAVEAYRAASEVDDRGDSHRDLGWAYLQGGRPEEAIGAYRMAIDLDADSAEAHDGLGTALRRAGRLDAAVEAHEEAVRLRPDFALAHNNLGCAFVMKNRLDDAVRAFKTAMRLDPDDPYPYVNLADAYRRLRKVPESLDVARKGVDRQPEHAGARTSLGLSLMMAGKPDEAERAFRSAIELSPDFEMAHRCLCALLAGRQRLEEAVPLLRRWTEIRPDSAAAWNGLAYGLRSVGKPDEAIVAAKKAIECDPSFAMAYNSLGSAFGDKGEADRAVKALRTAIELDPRQDAFRHNLVEALSAAGRLEPAIEAARERVEAHASHGGAKRLGALLLLAGRPEEAIAAYRRSLELQRRCPECLVQLGRALTAAGRLDRAIEAYRRALGLAGEDLAVRAGLAHVERLRSLEPRLEGILAGNIGPADAGEARAYAALAEIKSRHVAAARLWALAFELGLVDDVQSGFRYRAARAACLAAARGDDEATETQPDRRAHWRGRALAWLREALDALKAAVDAGTVKRRDAAARIRDWRLDSALRPLRESEALRDRPAAEREAIDGLWADVDRFLKRANDRKR